MVRADAAGSVLRAKSPLRGGSRHAAVTLRRSASAFLTRLIRRSVCLRLPGR